MTQHQQSQSVQAFMSQVLCVTQPLRMTGILSYHISIFMWSERKSCKEK